MCLAVPAQIVEINGNRGIVETRGVRVDIGLDLVDDIKLGDFVIVHAGYALEKLNDREAEKRLLLFEQLTDGGQKDA
jgi:hydrogenase expression/formation protein HypC